MRRARSITLIEVIFAITATTIAIFGALASINLSMQLDSISEDRAAAARALDQEVQALFAMDRATFLTTFASQPYFPKDPEGLVPLKNLATSTPDDTLPILTVLARGDGENQSPPLAFEDCDYYSLYIEATWDGGTAGEQRVAVTILVRPN